MALNVNDWIERLGPERRRQVEERAAELIAEEMTLRNLRKTAKATRGNLSLVARFPDLPSVERSWSREQACRQSQRRWR